MAVSLLTCTGERQEAFALCEHYMRRQTYKGPLEWIVVDDGRVPTKLTCNQKYFRGPRVWEPALNTQRYNMELALQKATGEYILIWEDDDLYAPTYIATMVELLKQIPIVGEGGARYFHIGIPGWKEMHNFTHCSLAQTAFRKQYVKAMLESVNSGDLYFDINFWKKVKEENLPACIFSNVNLFLGMKGMPGRTGIGVGHKQKDYYLDRGFAKLKEWLGTVEAAPYIKIYEEGKKKP